MSSNTEDKHLASVMSLIETIRETAKNAEPSRVPLEIKIMICQVEALISIAQYLRLINWHLKLRDQ